MKWKNGYRQKTAAQDNSYMGPNIRLGNNLKSILQAQGLSLKKISMDTQIPYSTLHTWLENRQPKDICKVKILCDYLHVDLDSLLFGRCDSSETSLPLQTSELAGSAATTIRVSGAVLPDGQSLEGEYEIIVRRRKRS